MGALSKYLELRARLIAQIGSTPVEWPNETFTPTGALYLRFQLTDDDEKQVDFGASTKTFRTFGAIMILVIAPTNRGAGAGLEMGDTVAGIYRNWCGATVRCRGASVRDLGIDAQGMHCVKVTVVLQRDELH